MSAIFVLYGLVIASWCLAPVVFASESQLKAATRTCTMISKTISPASSVFFPSMSLVSLRAHFDEYESTASLQYQEDISHWAGSSSQVSACSVEPGTVDDVGKIVSFHPFLESIIYPLFP